MIFDVVTIFPDMFPSVLAGSLLGKAIARGLVTVRFVDPREHGIGRHRSTDDTPYGGGSGMVMRPEPLVAAIEEAAARSSPPCWKVLMSPAGKPLDQPTVMRLAAQPHVVIVCGRYEGIDERVMSYVDEEISIGDYVLTGGELGAMVLIDALSRRLPGVLGNADSPVDESFESGLLEYPQYTRPAEFRGAAVPELLLGGNHARIRRWRRKESLVRTRDRRPDLFARLTLTVEDRALLDGEEP